MTGWRARLSDPPTPHTLPEIILLVLDIADEDFGGIYNRERTARGEFARLAGYDIFDALRGVIVATFGDGEPPKPDEHPPCDNPGCPEHGIAASNARQSKFYAAADAAGTNDRADVTSGSGISRYDTGTP